VSFGWTNVSSFLAGEVLYAASGMFWIPCDPSGR
jgi:hypothetical protein